MKKRILTLVLALTMVFTLGVSATEFGYVAEEATATELYNFKTILGEIGSYNFSHLCSWLDGSNQVDALLKNWTDGGGDAAASGFSIEEKDPGAANTTDFNVGFCTVQDGTANDHKNAFGINPDNIDNTYIKCSLTLADASAYDDVRFALAVTSATSTITSTGRSWGQEIVLPSGIVKQTTEKQTIAIPLSLYKNVSKTYLGDNGGNDWRTTTPEWEKINALYVVVDKDASNMGMTVNNLRIEAETISEVPNTLTGDNLKVGTVGVSETAYISTLELASFGKTYMLKYSDSNDSGIGADVEVGSDTSQYKDCTTPVAGTVKFNDDQRTNGGTGIMWGTIALNANLSAPTNTFGLTAASFEETSDLYLVFELTMEDEESYDDIHFDFSATATDNWVHYTGQPGIDVKVSDRIRKTTETQTVGIPLSRYNGLYSNIENLNAIKIHITPDQMKDTDGDSVGDTAVGTTNANMTFSNIRFGTVGKNESAAAYGIYTEEGTEVKTLADAAGKNIMVKAAVRNDKMISQNALVILALYKNGIMEDMVCEEVSVAVGANPGFETKALAVPSETTGYTIRAFLWDEFSNLQPGIDKFEIQ